MHKFVRQRKWEMRQKTQNCRCQKATGLTVTVLEDLMKERRKQRSNLIYFAEPPKAMGIANTAYHLKQG